MDFEDDPDITPWHLSQRMRMFEKLAEEEKKNKEKAQKLINTVQNPDRMIYTCKNVLLRLFLAIGFLAVCIGLLTFSITIDTTTTTTTSVTKMSTVSARKLCRISTVTYSKTFENSRNVTNCTVFQDFQNRFVKITCGNKRNCSSQFYVEIYFTDKRSYVWYKNDSNCRQLSCIYSYKSYRDYDDFREYLKNSFAKTIVTERNTVSDCETNIIGEEILETNKTDFCTLFIKQNLKFDVKTSNSTSVLSTFLQYFVHSVS